MEVCKRCGSSEFAVARNMLSTRQCKCGHQWPCPPKTPLTLDEFFLSTLSLMLLRQNLETNLSLFGEKMSEQDRIDLMRTNLIVVRQSLEGLE